MPLWLIKVLPYGIGAVMLLAAVAWINHEGYQRAENQNKLTQAIADKQRDDLKLEIDGKIHDVEAQMQTNATAEDQKLVTTVGNIQSTHETIIQPTLTKEIASAPRFSDPSAGITDGMRAALNRGRASSSGACSSSAVGLSCNAVSAGSATP